MKIRKNNLVLSQIIKPSEFDESVESTFSKTKNPFFNGYISQSAWLSRMEETEATLVSERELQIKEAASLVSTKAKEGNIVLAEKRFINAKRLVKTRKSHSEKVIRAYRENLPWNKT